MTDDPFRGLPEPGPDTVADGFGRPGLAGALEQVELERYRRSRAHLYPCACEPAPISADPCRHSDSSMGCPRHDFGPTGDDARAEADEHPECMSETRGITQGGDR
jgi:hypothetical protein